MRTSLGLSTGGRLDQATNRSLHIGSFGRLRTTVDITPPTDTGGGFGGPVRGEIPARGKKHDPMHDLAVILMGTMP